LLIADAEPPATLLEPTVAPNDEFDSEPPDIAPEEKFEFAGPLEALWRPA
jgi:hypothetical protein